MPAPAACRTGAGGCGSDTRRTSSICGRQRRWGLFRHGVPVEEQFEDADRADAVDEAVVSLRDQRPAAAFETIEQDHLPQWAPAVEAM